MSSKGRGGSNQRVQRLLEEAGQGAEEKATKERPRGGSNQRLARAIAAEEGSGASGKLTRGTKRATPEEYDSTAGQAAAEHEYRKHMAKLYLENKFSAKQANEAIQKAQAAGAKGADDLSKASLERHSESTAEAN